MVIDEYMLKNRTGTTALKLFHSVVPSGRRILREHHHTEFEISTIISGSGIYNVGDKEYEYRAGDVFVFGSDEMHCITEVFSDENFNLLNIHVEPRFLWADSSLTGSSLLKLFQGRSDNFENRLIRTNPATKEIRSMILKIEDEFKNREFEYEIIIKTTLIEIFVRLTRAFDYITDTDSHSPKADSLLQMEKAMEYIDKNICNSFTLDDLAHTAAMNPSYFSTTFKKFNGISPWDYITIKRVEQAIFLLNTTTYTKFDIAEKCGFSSMSNFYKAFKKVTGKHPSDYIKESI